ncbi:MAG: formate dehydrogenase accessory protein FdhE [Thiobacillus sp. 63-78]|uniref:formate dehydrogenase accessory protein FdhE n=1 Tax=Thiobacillus sp. 63-78 TaxID=1895859 RepID=UPI0009688688|nr:formate dehydrogenase accessory protein FdhE [Thiobacillus sp. 63-78]OJZ16512.1 MAG: formate dehydrogenase accessory protein FdhE [Thiobacillus sp. 63-78]
MTTTLLQPGEIEAAAGDIPELRLPPADLFLMRARRLEQLSEGHALGDYLRFVARLAHAQQAALDAGPAGEPPAADRLAQCREYQMPPLAPAGLALPAGWRDTARQLAQAVKSGLPAPGQTALEPILSGEDAWLDAQAVQLFEGHTQALDAAIAPVIGAALQVHWSHLARQLHPAQVARPEHPNLCPVCGSHPVSSMVRIGGAENGLRYLHCTLCNSEWHVVRAKCSNCDNTRDIACYHLEGKDRLVQAESCPECQTYLKVIHQEKDPQADPVADDLATLTLDLLMDEAGFARSGINWYLIHGPA